MPDLNGINALQVQDVMPENTDSEVFDIIGCGFGPANLAIAVALVEKWDSAKTNGVEVPIKRVLFIDRYHEFQWHPGMLIPGSQMQISCLKDLAMLRNPNSKFTFLSYLHSQNRLLNFINRGSMMPPRREFADYLSWAANKVQENGVQIAYAEEVVGLCREEVEGIGECLFEITSRRTEDQVMIKRRTKHLIISPGGSAYIPPILSSPILKSPTRGDNIPIIHTSSYMGSLDGLLRQLTQHPLPLKIAIIGSGQSAAEVLLDLHSRLNNISIDNGDGSHELHVIMRKGSFKPSDDSPFVNEIFNPESTDAVYNLPSSHSRRTLLAEYKNTNYGVVSQRIIDTLYEILYEQNLADGITSRSGKINKQHNTRICLLPYQKIIGASVREDEERQRQTVTLTSRQSFSNEVTEATYDAVICGTGYDRVSWIRLLHSSNFAKDFGLGGDGHAVSINGTHDDDGVDYLPYEFAEDPIGDAMTNAQELSTGTSSRSDSSLSNSLTSESLSINIPRKSVLRISRSYRLLPDARTSPDVAHRDNRIYLQGCAEATHGLSDTLLSVLSVRAGEVVEDLCRN